jgi:hypothetical protein
MYEKGVTACILHLSVLRTRSSILCIVLASNTYLASPTWSTGSKQGSEQRDTIGRRVVSESLSPAGREVEEQRPPPSWRRGTGMPRRGAVSSKPDLPEMVRCTRLVTCAETVQIVLHHFSTTKKN